MEYTIKIDFRAKGAKAILELLNSLPFIKVKEKSPYNEAFVRKIKRAEKEQSIQYKSAEKLWDDIISN
jgi:hypothetical protein